MEYKRIKCDLELCSGCALCEFACAAAKSGAFDPTAARIHVARPEPTVMGAISCQLCENAPCIPACPKEALTRHPEYGIIVVDKVRCIGCGWCLEACEYGAITIDPRTKMAIVCDLCLGEPEPRCVALCPKGALDLALAGADRS